MGTMVSASLLTGLLKVLDVGRDDALCVSGGAELSGSLMSSSGVVVRNSCSWGPGNHSVTCGVNSKGGTVRGGVEELRRQLSLG